MNNLTTLKTLWDNMYTFTGIGAAIGALVGWEWLGYIVIAWAIVIGIQAGNVVANWIERQMRIMALKAAGKLRRRNYVGAEVVSLEDRRRMRGVDN